MVNPSLAHSYWISSVILLIDMLLNLHKPLKSSILKKISHMYLQQSKLSSKNVIEWHSPCDFENTTRRQLTSRKSLRLNFWTIKGLVSIKLMYLCKRICICKTTCSQINFLSFLCLRCCLAFPLCFGKFQTTVTQQRLAYNKASKV